MSYFGDILDGAHGRMDIKADEPGNVEDPKALAFKAKSSAGGLSLSQGIDLVKKGEDYQQKTKTEAKKKFDEEHTVKLTAKNKEYEVEWNFSPADLNKDGQQTEMSVTGTCNPAAKGGADIDIAGKLKFGGIGTDTIKSWTEVEACTDGKTLHKAEFSQNFHAHSDGQCYSAGVAGEWCAAHGKMEKLQAQLVAQKFSWGDAWLKVNMLNSSSYKGQFVSMGASSCDKDCHSNSSHHSVEATYDLSKKFKGFQGMPLMLNWGACHHLDNKVTLKTMMSLKDEWISTNKVEIPAADGFKLVYSDKCDAKKLLTPKDFWYKAGVSVEFKL